MPKRVLARALAEKVGYSQYRAEKLVDTVVGLIKRGLGDGKSIELGRLGVMEAVTRKPRRKIVRLKHVGTTIVTENKLKKSVKLRSSLDLSTEEEKVRNKTEIAAQAEKQAIPAAVPKAVASSPKTFAVAAVRWRARAHRIPSRTTSFRK